MADRGSVPKDRIFIIGTGCNQDVTGVCADDRFDGTYALEGSGTDLSLTLRNESMVDRLHHARGLGG